MKLILCLLLEITYVAAQIGGPYDLHVRALGECKDPGAHEMIVSIKSKPVNVSTLWITGGAILPYGWTDRFVVTTHASTILKNGKTQEMLVKNMGGACSAIRVYAPEIARQAFAMLGRSKDCPKPGNYTNLNSNITFSLPGVPVAVYGKYRVQLDFTTASDNRKIGCIYVIAEFLPKKASKKRKGK